MPSQVVGGLAEELRKLGLVPDAGTLDSNGNPVFKLAAADDKFFRKKLLDDFTLCMWEPRSIMRAWSLASRAGILKGRTVSLFSTPGSPFEKDVEHIRFIDSVIGELRLKKQATPELLAEALAARAPENGLKFDDLEKAAIRTMDNMFITAIKGEALSAKPS